MPTSLFTAKILHKVRHPMLIFLFCRYVLHNDVTSCMATSDARRLVAGQHITTGMCPSTTSKIGWPYNMPLSFMHEVHIFSYIRVPVRSLYVLKSCILCIQYEHVFTFTDTWHYDGLHNLWLLTHTRCLQDGSIDYTASNDLQHHCSRLSEICPQSENRCCADLSPSLPVSQLVTQPIRPLTFSTYRTLPSCRWCWCTVTADDWWGWSEEVCSLTSEGGYYDD